MKRNGEQNIIFDDDVTISKGANVGRKLSDVINEQESKMEGLASNIKWLYKYGGVGSGSGGGGGSTSWSVQVTRTDTGEILRDGVTVNFGKENVYGIRVQVYNGGTSTFKVTYNYVNSKGTQTRNEVIWAENGFVSQQALNLDINGNLSITILNQDNPDEGVITYVIPYIVTSYRFTLQYVYSDTLSPVVFGNNTIFMSEVKNRGIKVLFTSNVSVELTSSSYTYVDWNGTSHVVGMNEPNSIEGETNKLIYLDLIPDSPGQEEGQGIKDFLQDNSNARFKQFLLNIDILLKGNTVHEQIPELSLKDNLIPSDMYLKVTASGGTIYDTPQTEYPENSQFVIGTIPFNLTPYDGAYDPNKKYNLEVYDAIRGENDEWVETRQNLNVSQLSDQKEQTITVQVNTSGEHRIRFKIIYGTSYEVCYFFFVKESSSTFTWYEPNKNIETQAYYRNNQPNGVLNVSGIDASTPIEMTLNSQRQTYQFTVSSPGSGLNEFDQFLTFGIQYSEINDTSIPILTVDIDDNIYNTGRIFVYQDKVLIASTNSLDEPTGEKTDIFIPLSETFSQTERTNYHLISIYKRFEIIEGNSYFKTISVYLDGVLEGVFKQTTALHTPYTGVTFYEGNYFCNLFEYTTFRHNSEIDNAYYSDSDTTAPFLTDNDIVCYYYTYKEQLLNLTVTENEKDLYTLFSQLREDADNFIHTNEYSINNISEKSEIPVIVLNSIDNEGNIGGISGYNQDNFKLWMSAVYQENSVLAKVPVTLQWKGKNDTQLKTISKQGETSAASFSVTLQGSSTLGYRCKNFELMAPLASDNDYECIFSPNFDPNDTNTFLPESSFTLKADVVDSSHTNNNAIGKFVNSVTTPFERAKQSAISSVYSSYIKNCLIGFPVLVFLHTSYKSDENVPTADVNQFYLLGIYNFNLGRNSYFNLGYKDVSKLENLTGGLSEGFNIYEIANSENTLLNGIVVGEIQGNNEFFDFSQADASILFSNGPADLTYMFGDFVDGNGSDAVNAKTQIERFVKKVSMAGGYVFTEVGKTFNTTPTDWYGYKQGYSAVDEHGTPLNQVPSYQFKAERIQIGSESTYEFTPLSDLGDESDLLNLLIYDSETHNEPSLDYASLCEYYTTCMAFGLVDSVQKNLNIKSWNAAPNSEYPLFYVAFYDMDTCLGVSNSGSRIDYFAFSDYWQSKIEDNALKTTEVYRDFSPKNNSGDDYYGSFFDVPSSYLFAIAKYGFFVKNGMDEVTASDPLYYHPSNLWAIWRNKDKINNPSNNIDRQKGCLSDANRFMEDYYIKHLEGTPYSAFNLNYRYKYLVKNVDRRSYDDTNFEKFYGRKIAYTWNWLDGRLHLLDAYFNINSIPDVIVENSVYAPYASNDLVDKTNKDIYVLKDIFSTSANGNQYAQLDTSIIVKSRPYAPLIVRSSNTANRYIFPQTSESCIISLRTSGNQYLLYGGSSLWTEINTINPFITSNKTLTVDSKYFTNLVGNNDVYCNTWNITAPSLKTISLTGPNYSGNLDFTSSGSIVNFPNLNSVNISGTDLRLLISNAYVETIEAVNMKSSSAIDISNVQTLRNVSINGSMSSLNIPTWKGDGVYFPTNWQNNNNQQFNCVTMTVSNDTNKYPNNKLYVYNNATLTKLSITGFSEVYVENCPKLTEIVISDRNVLTKLSVVMPQQSTHTTFTIGSESGVVDLSSQELLTYVKFNYCKMTTIKMPPNDIDLPTRAFYGCSNLTYLIGNGAYKCYITGTTANEPYTFANCVNFTLRQSETIGDISPIYVKPETTSLYRTFYIEDRTTRGSIDLNTTSIFLQNNCLQASNVTDISEMFYNQNIVYDKNTLITEYLNGVCSLSLSKFTKVSTTTRVFVGNKISGYNRYMLSGLGSNVSSINIVDMVGEISSRDTYNVSNERWKVLNGNRYHVLYATYDFLYDVLDKISSLEIYGYSYHNSYLYFIDTTGSIVNEVKVGLEVFRKDNGDNTYTYPVRLSSISDFEIFPQHTINLENMFWYTDSPRSGWIAAGENGLYLSTFLYYGAGAYTNFSNISHLLSYIKLKSVSTFLNGFSSGTTGVNRIDMYEFINWENINETTNLFYSENGYLSIGFYKQISYTHFKEIWTKILESPSLTSIAYLFRNCIITTNSEPQVFKLCDDTSIVNTKIRNTYHLFDNCKISRSVTSSEYLPMNIHHSFLSCLPKLVNVPYLFTNTLWGNPIPFDFFNKRIENTRYPVYVGEERTPATLYTYTYTQDMVNMYACFRNVTFNNTSRCFKSDGLYNDDSFLKNRVVDSNENISYEYYDTTESDAPLVSVIQNSEINDTLNAEAPNATEWVSSINSISTTNLFTNFEAAFHDGTSGCFVTPDIYYGMASSGSDRTIEYSLGITTSSSSANAHGMSGLIPPSLLKNVKLISPRGIFSNLNILPWFVGNYHVQEDNININYNCYCYIPSNFTNYSNLNEVFNFHLILPYTTQTTRSKYFVFKNDSIPSNTQTLTNSLPGSPFSLNSQNDNQKESLIGDAAGYPNTAANDMGIRYNIMFEEQYRTVETAWEYQNVVPEPEDIGMYQSVPYVPSSSEITWTSPEHIYVVDGVNVDYYDKVATATGEMFFPIEGLDMNKFTKLKLDSLINIPLSMFLSGNLFKDGTMPTWSKQKYLANTSSYVVNIGYNGSWSNGLSRKAKLPLTISNDNFIQTQITTSRVNICKDSVINGYSSAYQTSGGYPFITFIN